NFAFFKKHALKIRKALGLIIILNLLYMISIEQGLFPYATVKKSAIRTATYLEKGLWRPYPAPEIAGIATWLNSPPLRLQELKGKVVLIDFWTYSCINCLRTLPYLKEWYKQYHAKGLEIIGVHSPEFDFEKKAENVQAAIKRYDIPYPVALDNSFVTWRLFSNHYWPAHYLINPQGLVVYEHFGEGDYDVMENNIRFLLGIDQTQTKPNLKMVNDMADYFAQLSPETYLGYVRADSVLSPYLIRDKMAKYEYPKELKPNAWALKGEWLVASDKIRAAKANAALQMHFQAGKVYAVMGNATDKPIVVHVLLNGKAFKKPIKVDKYSLYEVLALPEASAGILQIISQAPGLEIYTLTFGN
ncbi:MAG: thioredoxin family protein, partial [Legionella sp.]